jgi:S1-C subfamily serine protease
MTRLLMLPLAAVALLGSVACGGPAAMEKTAEAPATDAPLEKPASGAEAASDHSLRRSAVRMVLKGGLGLFLQRVTLEDQPVLKDGRFHGFRIAALRDPRFWSGVDLRAGDVVVRVNGMSIEHPEDALEAFHALEAARELRVFYERDGQPRELTYPIVDDELPKRADASAP